ncbi:MAG: hypothetical protein FD546_000151 [Pelagibacterales bacterium]|nr:hypothetical protein [Pelagibacterales bacterium]
MNKYKNYLFFLLKVLFKFQWEYSLPKPKKYLIIDGINTNFLAVFNKKDYNVLYRRGEKINLPILLKCFFELKLTSTNYYLKYIHYSKPKLILTNLDHINIFYKLSELTKIKTLMLQWGSKTWGLNSILVNKEFNNSKNKKFFYIDYIFVHNEKTKKLYSKFVRGKIIVLGSFFNNFGKLNIHKKKEILYLSTFRGKSLYSWLAGDEVVIQSLSTLAKKNNLKFNILGRSMPYENDEKKYYSNIMRENYNYIPKSKFLNSYKVMEKYDYVFTGFTTMGKENLARGGKTGMIFYKPNKDQRDVLKLGYGQFEGLKKSGPFWSSMNKFRYSEVKRIFYFVTKSNKNVWKKIKPKYIDPVMSFNHNNKKFYKIIKNINT